MKSKTSKALCLGLIVSVLFAISGCGKKEKITSLNQLNGKEFAVPTGTAADTLILSKFPDAKFKYFNSVLDAALAVKNGKADAAGYDEPILKNIAAKNGGLVVLQDMITKDSYGFAVQLSNKKLKENIDLVINELKSNGKYDAMLARWLPKSGNPGAMPEIVSSGSKGVLKLGTATITEPFSFVDSSQNAVGFDIELASYVAQKLDMKLEIVKLEFGALIPALSSGKVDMIASCITITEERAKKVLFSEPYYIGGIAALVKE